MATEPQSPTPEEERPEATDAQQRVEAAAPAPEPTPLDALKQRKAHIIGDNPVGSPEPAAHQSQGGESPQTAR